MKSFFRFTLIVCLLGLLVYGANLLYFKLTDGFSVGNITSHYPDDPLWQVHELSADERQEIDKALHQNYYYLAKGHQAYVFISRDGNYVIKFPKFHRNRIKPWLEHLILPAALESYRQGRIDFKNARMDGVLQSWKTAFNHLQEENGLLLVHINSSEGKYPVLHIEDKIGVSHELDLDKMTFLIQKRAELICPAIDRAMANQNVEAAKGYIDAVVDLFMGEYQRGFAETDKWVLRNTGFVNRKAIHVDVGRFVADDKYKSEEVQRTEIVRKTAELRAWLTGRYSELVKHLDSKINGLM